MSHSVFYVLNQAISTHRDIKKTPEKTEELFSLTGSKRGVALCERALNCSRVCLTDVYPARHIADLRKLLANKNLEKTKA
jgi:succinate dehydrogenase/fumarate reductase-like Fe-S protein